MHTDRIQRLSLDELPDNETVTRIAALPGVHNATCRETQLALHYDLRQTELQSLIHAGEAFGVVFARQALARLQRWIKCLRDHNRRQHLSRPAGWQQYLQDVYLMLDDGLLNNVHRDREHQGRVTTADE